MALWPVLARGDGLSASGVAIDYTRDIRPILSDACFACHGPDEESRQAKLRLDNRADATSARGSAGPAIVPGDPEASELIFRIESDDETVRMPPPEFGKTLTPKQVALLREWVAQGATYAEHWAFTAVEAPAIPEVSNPAWVRNPIDAFVLARLDREGLSPSPEADRVTLIRRLSLDLIGLPPTVEEVDAFVADRSPDAYEQLVERLLASPHYGERWGRLWLDAARYADSDGYEKDKKRSVWFYRDWVVRAFNDDRPYDQFVIEQLAGDLLPGATQDQRVATGFLRNSMINEEGGIDPEQFRMEAMFDRMDALGTAILGLTLRCAQCHNHKYDPITQEDYYRLFAYLNDSDEAAIAVYTPEEQAKRADVLSRIGQIEAELQQMTPDWESRMAAWEATVRDDGVVWTVITPTAEDNSTGGQKYLKQPDGSLLAQGYAPTKHRVRLEVDVPQSRITAFRLELLTDPNLPLGGPGRSIWGTGALTEFEVEAAPLDQPEKVTRVAFRSATANVNPPRAPLDPIFDDRSGTERVTGPVGYAIDGDPATAWGIDVGPGRTNQPRQAVFVAETPIENPSGSRLTIYLAQNHGGWNSDDNQNCNLGRFRLAITDASDPVADPLPAAAREALAVPADQRTPAQRAALFSYWRTTVPEWAEANERIEAIWKEYPRGTSQLVLSRRSEPRTTSLLHRGDFLKPVRPVEPGVPSFLNPLPENARPDRLTLARWLVDRRAPTTARAYVNRVWQALFGTGLVETAEDLGVQGSLPSHPELLDWLAATFMDRGWRTKELLRLVVQSNTYRQASTVRAELVARDPSNRLLARGPRVRVDAELVRDLALAASGLLDQRIGGPPTYPPAPEFLFVPPASYGPKVWIESKGPERYRRTLYTFRFRSVPYPALQVFDAPNGDLACVRRTRSNTPLQALTTLNEPLFVEAARALALRTLGEGGGEDRSRLTYAFRRCVARAPTEAEVAVLAGLLKRQKKYFREPGRDPWQLAANDPQNPPALPEGTTPEEAAAWTVVCRVLLNLDETITKE
jgi:mono/diheme cytochrome c family protein